MLGKQYLAAIRPADDLLILETMYFADEVRDPAGEVDNLPAKARVGGKDLEMAVSLVESLTTSWDPKNYRDTYAERVEKLVDAKSRDREIVVRETADESEEKVTDLLGALQASIDAAKRHKPGNTDNVSEIKTRKRDDGNDERTRRSTAKKSTAKKSTAKKSTAKKSTAKRSAAKKSTSNGSRSKAS
jgi:DNA end-binding protein Ku